MGGEDPWAEMKPQPVRKARKASKSEVFQEKAERARTAAEEAVKAGSCPRCGVAVLYAREVGLLTVVEAVPVSADVEGWIKAQRATYSLVGSRLKLRNETFTQWSESGDYAIHPEHTQCGKCAPVPAPKLEKVKGDDPWSDVPPFDPYEGMKTWRCWDCDTLIEPKDQGVAISYDGDHMTYYMCHCDKACEPRSTLGKVGRKGKVYPKIDKFGKRAEPKKGEVGFE